MAALSRRSRMRRNRTGKRIELTARDLEIFRILASYRYLPSTYIHAFVGGASETRFKERLGDLFHEGYVDRPDRQWEMADSRHRPVVHELGAGARRVLEQQPGHPNPRTWLSASAHRQFLHSAQICEVLASIELGARSRSNLRFISWSEILAKAPEDTRALSVPYRLSTPMSGEVVPDALFGLEYAGSTTKGYRFFALEVDRGTMPVMRSDPTQSSCLGKLAVYRQAIAHLTPKVRLGLPNLFVLTTTTSEARLAELLAKLAGREGSPRFLFKALGDRPGSLRKPATQLLEESWQRACLPPLHIAESQ